MKKKLLTISLLIIMGTGCMNNNSNSKNNSTNSSINTSSISTNTESISNSSTIDNVEVTDIELLGYQDTLEFLNDFDTASVNAKVKFSDNSEINYTEKDLTFNFNEFSNTELGRQEIGVTINELQVSESIEVEVIPAKEISVLMVGNSYSDDTAQWVNEICSDLNIKVTIGNLYIGGCTLDTHFKNLMNNNNAYEFRTYDNVNKKWNTQYNTSIETALKHYDWQYVTLQQGSAVSGVESSYSNLDGIIELIYDIKIDVKFIWNMTWAYQQDSGHSNFGNYANSQSIMYQSIINTVQSEIVGHDEIRAIIPNGTAVQNARTSFLGDTLCRDVYCHLTYDFGRYIAGLSLVKTLTGVDISTINYAPGGVDKTYKQIAIESVNNAINNPFEVTNSIYDKEPTVDLSNHIEIDYQPIGCAYYHSDTYNYNTLVTSVNISMNYVASKTFTKDELPVGSIIHIESGYQYRPEGWIDNAPQSSRPSNVSTRYIEVDEAWWGDYTIRAFNISSTSGSLMYKMKEAMSAFHIYVPKDANIEIDNSLKVDDTSLFETNDLDIANYDNYKYSFQNGFYNSSSHANQQIDFEGSFANKFICTESFTKETLPVGSILVIDEGYQYRPDAWIGNEINNNRPNNVTTKLVVIDEAWWGDYTIKGFNISKIDGTAINQTPYEAVSHFRIYIPTNK